MSQAISQNTVPVNNPARNKFRVSPNNRNHNHTIVLIAKFFKAGLFVLNCFDYIRKLMCC